MSQKIPQKCPACSGQLKVTGMECRRCGTEIRGDFELDDLFQLTPDQLEFLKIFIGSRGSIKEVEKELDMSYPTVRSKLDNLISSLGFEQPGMSRRERDEKRNNLLDRLEKGEIDPQQAAEELKNL